ncbi:hypothetical protein SUDANB126_01785 [Streptomyces sp. enrichment culture]
MVSYDLALGHPGTGDRPLRAVTTVDARVTADLDRLNPDFAHGIVHAVEADGGPAAFTTAGEDLAITPEDAPGEGERTRITVRHSSDPVAAGDREGGWVRTADGLVMANQADAAHLVFPCNDPLRQGGVHLPDHRPRRPHGRRRRAAGRCRPPEGDHHVDLPDPASHGHRARPGVHLTGFLDPWLHGATTPPMPGHPEWTSTAPAATPAGRASPRTVRVRPCVDRTRGGNNTMARRAVPCDHRRVRAARDTGISRGTRTLRTVTERSHGQVPPAGSGARRATEAPHRRRRRFLIYVRTQ